MRHRTVSTAMCLLFAIVLFPLSVWAQDGASVVILKFERFEASDEIVDALAATLSAGIEAHADMHVKQGGELNIKDLALAAGCSQPDEACMKSLREFVEADRIVFGSVQVSGDVHLFSMKMFDFAEGRFVAELSDQTVQGSVDHVEEVLPAVVDGFLYGDVGAVVVNVSGVDTAELLFDGEKVGLAPTTLENLPLGEHVVTVRTSDGEEQVETIVLRQGQPSTLDFEFAATGVERNTRKGKKGGSIVPAIVSIGVGAAGLGLGVFSALQVNKANDDNKRLGDEGFVDPATGAFTSSDAVADARAADLDPEKIEKRAKTFQLLQFVGYGVGAVGIGVGIALLAMRGGSESEPEAALPFDFGVVPTSDGVAASVGFRF